MAGAGDLKLWRASTTKSAVILACVGILVACAALWLGQSDALPAAWSSAVMNVGGVVLATSLITVGWDVAGKRSFAAEVMAVARLSADVERAGILNVTDQYLHEVEWEPLFKDAMKVDIVVAYANTWRNTHLHRLKAVAATKGARLRIFLPDPGDQPTMDALARRFATTASDIASKVREAICEFSKLETQGGATVQVYTRPGDMLFSCYRFDQRAVITLYSHQRRRTQVPTWVVKHGTLFTFVYDEVDAIRTQSTLVEPGGGSDREDHE